MERRRLAEIEEHVFDLFRQAGTSRLLTQRVFDVERRYANADLVRAFEDLEKKWRLLTRYTEEGNDWLQLTAEGAAHAGLPADESIDRRAHPHPPRSSTNPST